MKGRTKKYHRGDMTQEMSFDTNSLIQALFDVEDLMERCSCPFFLLDETARQVREETKNLEPHLELNEITIGIRQRHLAQSVKEMIRTIKPQAEWLNSTISYSFGDIPVVIWIIRKDHSVFERPDRIWFYTADLCIPNPFDTYWQNRDILLT
jgi:hypothetical protein